MTKDYTAIRVSKEAREAAKEAKVVDETWDDYIRRCTEKPPEVKEFVEASDDSGPVTLEATTINKIADEIEGRMK